jgi:hypothetical protein
MASWSAVVIVRSFLEIDTLSYYPRLDINLCIGLFRDEKKVCQFLRNCEQ